jgi:hypothetical protein
VGDAAAHGAGADYGNCLQLTHGSTQAPHSENTESSENTSS